MTNDISLISQDNLEQFRALRLFDYQNNWHNIKNNSELNRIRLTPTIIHMLLNNLLKLILT